MNSASSLKHPTEKANVFSACSSRSLEAYNKILPYLQNRTLVLLFALLLEAGIWGLDIITAPHVFLTLLFLIPIALSAWSLSLNYSLVIVLLSSIGKYYVKNKYMPEISISVNISNFVFGFLFFLGFALLMHWMRSLLDQLSDKIAIIQNLHKQLERKAELQSSIRRALPKDADEIAELAIENGFVGEAGQSEFSKDYSKQSISASVIHILHQGMINKDVWSGGTALVPVEYWVAIHNGTVAGFISVAGYDGKNVDDRELHIVVVAEAYRGLGIGSSLLDFFCAHYRGRRIVAACKPNSLMRDMLKRRNFEYLDDAEGGFILTEHR